VIRIFDIPGQCWPQLIDHGPFVDRTETSISEYLESLGLFFVSNPRDADIFIRKAELSFLGDDSFSREFAIREKKISKPSLFYIGEPRELAAAAYHYADPRATLAVAPGHEFKRFRFGRPWSDPELESWSMRSDRIVWIGRPIGHRLAIAKKLIEWGLPLDIYSREPWPLDCWKGPAKDDVETARHYKFRIACENSNAHQYHSEKLFTSLRSGCVTFYWGDPELDLSFAQGTHLKLTRENLERRFDHAPQLIEGMNRFLFSNRWEVYSIRQFIDQLNDSVRNALGAGKHDVKLSPPSISISSSQLPLVGLDQSLGDRKA